MASPSPLAVQISLRVDDRVLEAMLPTALLAATCTIECG